MTGLSCGPHCQETEPIADTAWVARNQRQDSLRPRIEPNMTANKYIKKSMNWFLVIFCYTHRSTPPKSHQRGIIQQLMWADEGTHSQKLSRARAPTKRRRRKNCRSQIGWEHPENTAYKNQLNRAHRGSQRLKGQTWTLHIPYGCAASCYCGTPNSGNRRICVSESCPLLGTLFLLLGFHI